MMARSNPHSSMPSPARSPLGENDDGLGIMARTDHDDKVDDNKDDDDGDDHDEEDEVSELRGVKRADTTPCYTKWSGSGGQTIAAKKTGELGSQNSFLFSQHCNINSINH